MVAFDLKLKLEAQGVREAAVKKVIKLTNVMSRRMKFSHAALVPHKVLPGTGTIDEVSAIRGFSVSLSDKMPPTEEVRKATAVMSVQLDSGSTTAFTFTFEEGCSFAVTPQDAIPADAVCVMYCAAGGQALCWLDPSGGRAMWYAGDGAPKAELAAAALFAGPEAMLPPMPGSQPAAATPAKSEASLPARVAVAQPGEPTTGAVVPMETKVAQILKECAALVANISTEGRALDNLRMLVMIDEALIARPGALSVLQRLCGSQDSHTARVTLAFAHTYLAKKELLAPCPATELYNLVSGGVKPAAKSPDSVVRSHATALLGAIYQARPDVRMQPKLAVKNVNVSESSFHKDSRQNSARYQKAALTAGGTTALEKIRTQLVERGVTSMRGLATRFKIMDNDGSKTLNIEELGIGLREIGLKINPSDLQNVFQYVDIDGGGTVNLDEFIIAVRGKLSAGRQALVDQAFQKLDKDGSGKVTVDDCRGVYDVSNMTQVLAGQMSEDEALAQFLSSFEQRGEVDGVVTVQEFRDYYAGVSASVDSDAYFALMITNAWRL